jgi:hypothetical protein
MTLREPVATDTLPSRWSTCCPAGPAGSANYCPRSRWPVAAIDRLLRRPRRRLTPLTLPSDIDAPREQP